jgi:hypothetical protein
MTFQSQFNNKYIAYTYLISSYLHYGKHDASENFYNRSDLGLLDEYSSAGRITATEIVEPIDTLYYS